MALVNNAETIGKGTKNLVLETAGHIYVKVNERYYELDFRNSGEKLVGKSIVETVQTPEEIDLSEYITNDDLKKALKKYVTAKSWEDVIDTQTALQNSLLDFEEAIKPITVQTMQVVVGTEELQFDWIESFTNPNINVDPPLYIDENPSSNHYGQLVWNPGYIKHYTIDGPDKVQPDSSNSNTYGKTKDYWRWYITNSEGENEIEEVPLSDTFYVYLKVPYSKEYTIDGSDTNGGGLNGANIYIAADGNLGDRTASGNMAKTGVGKVVYSDTAIKFGPETENGITYYYLLYAIVTNSDGSPSISTLNGFTEILPGQIRAYIFASPDGESYLDLMHSKLKLRDKLVFNEDGKGNLYIKGAIVQDTGGNSQAATVYRDTWERGATYCPGNIVVVKDGNNVVGSYRCTGEIPKGGTADTVKEYERDCYESKIDPPLDPSHWVCISKGSTSIVTAGLYYLDSDDDFTAIPTDENGIIQSTITPWTIHLKMYEGSSPIEITKVDLSIPDAISNAVSIENKGNGDIKISVISGQKIEGTHKISFTATGATSDTSNSTVKRSFLYTISGIQNADPNTMYFLRPSTNQIKYGDKSGISCQVFKNSPNGSNILDSLEDNMKITYSIDNSNTVNNYSYGNTIDSSSISSKIVFTLTVNNIVYDKETILVVRDGTHGTSVAAVKDYYYASNSPSSDSCPAIGRPEWTINKVPDNYGLDNPYLWNYEETYNSDNIVINTIPITLLCYYGKDGVSIGSIIEYYAATASKYINPNSWTENEIPSGYGPSKPYLWNYEKIYNTKGGLINETSPIIISHYGKNGTNGKGIASITNYYLATDKSSGVTREDNSWTTTPQEINKDKPYLWNYEVITYSDNSTPTKSDPHIIGHYGVDGVSPNTAFKSTVFKRSNEAPGTPEGGSYNDPKPSESFGWSDGIPAGEEILWASTRIFSSNGEYPQQGEWTDPKQMTDTSDFEVAFSSLEDPGTPDGPPNTENNTNWSDTASTDTIWMATAVKKNGKWGNWQISRIKGEKGNDGTSINIKGTLESVEKLPKPPKNPSDCYIINGELYVWNGEKWVNVGKFTGDDGDTAYIHIKYANSLTEGDWTDKDNEDETLRGESPGKYIGIYWDHNPDDSLTWSNYKWSKWEGEDGFGYEYIYRLTTDFVAPAVPESGPVDPSGKKPEENNYVPKDWTDDPTGVDKTNQYEWVCYRQKVDGKWGNFIGSASNSTKAALWAKYGIDGTGISDIRDYYITTIDTTTPEAVFKDNTYIPYNGNDQWKRLPTDVTHNADYPYIWKVEVILFDGDKGKTPICTSPVIIGVFTVDGINAALLTLTTSSYIFSYESHADIPTNEEITLNAFTQNVTPKDYIWKYTNSTKNGAYVSIPDSDLKSNNYILNYDSALFDGTDSVTIRVSIEDPNNKGNWLFDEVTIFKIHAVSGLTLTCYLDNPCFDIPVKQGIRDFSEAFSNLHVVVDGEEVFENFTVTTGDADVIYSYDETTKISKIYIDDKTTKSPGRYSVPITITYDSKYISTLNLDFEIDNDGYVELTYSNSAFVWNDINQSYTPNSISITANSYDINNAKYTGSYTWQYLNSDGEWTDIGTGSTLEISANSEYFNGNRTATIKCSDSTLNDDYDTATFFLIKDGASNYLLDLSNESASVPANADGIIQGIDSLHCKATLFYGSSKPSGVTYTLTVPEGVSGVRIDPNTGEFTFENSFTFSGDVASLVVEAKIGDIVKGTATMNISKIKPGSNGDPATVYWLIPSANQIVIDKDGNLNPSTISVSGFQQTGNGEVVAAEGVSYKWGYNTSTPESDYIKEIGIDSAQSFITFSMYKEGKQIDSETVPILKDGQDGTPAFTVFLTNPNHIFPATEEGAVASTDRVGVMVYEGTTLYNRTQYFVTVADPRGLIQATTYENDDPTNYIEIGDTQINVIDFYLHECSKKQYLNDSRKKVITVYKGSVENQGEALAVLEYNWSISWSGEPGAKGDDGPITRVRKFQSTADENTILVYNDGTYTETDGKKYLDFVFYQEDNNYYQCIKPQTITGSNEAIAPSDTTHWSLINNFKPIATSVLLVGANAEGWIIDEGIIKHTSDAISLKKNGEINAGDGTFSVSKEGILTATSGKIGNWEITTTGLVGKDIETESTTETGEDVSGTQYGGGGHDSKHYSIITKCKEVSIEKNNKSKSGYSEARIGSNVLPVGISGTATGYFYNSLPKGLWTEKTDIVNLEWHDDTLKSAADREAVFNDFITSDAALAMGQEFIDLINSNCSTLEQVCLIYGNDIIGYGFNPIVESLEGLDGNSYDVYSIYMYNYHRITYQWVPLSTNYGIISDVSNAKTNYSFYSPNGSAFLKNGSCISWSSDYKGYAYSNTILSYLDKTNYFVFTGADSPGNIVYLPTTNQLIEIGAINKIFEITILVTTTPNKVYIVSDDGYGKLLDNNDNIIKQSTPVSDLGDKYYNYIEMTKGDILTLLFDGTYWHKKVHSS